MLLIGVYRTAHDPVDCECIICGYTWSISPNSLLSDRGCKNCTGTLRLTLDQYRETLIELGKDFVLTGEYKNQLSRITCHCNTCGHTRTVSAASLRKGGCPGCSLKVKYTLETLQNRLNEEDRPIRVLSKTYISKKTPLLFECTVCLHTWETTAGNVLNGGTGCSECALTGMKFTLPCTLYYMRVTRDGKEAYKIGITGKVNSLLRYHSESRAKIELLYEYRFETGKEAKAVEKSVLNLYKDFLYCGQPLLDHTGTTEMFSCDVLQLGHLKPKAVKNAK